MKNLTPSLMEKAKAAKNAEELLAFAKENGVDMSLEEANEYYQQISSCELDDDLLDGVAGGYAQEVPLEDNVQNGVVCESPFNSVSTARPVKTGCR